MHVELPDVPPLPPADLRTRLVSSELMHRAYPRHVDYLLSWLMARWRWRDPGYRDWCRDSMRYLLARSPRADEVDRLALRWGYMTIKRSALLWRPWLGRKLPVSGLDRLLAAKAQGRGVVLTFTHHGWFPWIFTALRRGGLEIHLPVAPYLFDPPKPGYQGRRDRQQLVNVATGGEVFGAVHALPRIHRLLGKGRLVAHAVDMPGHSETSFLGRTVFAGDSPARIADAADALVVPLTMAPWRDLARVQVEEPIDPRDHATADDLHAAIVARHEPAVLAWPEALEWPLRRWLEEPVADAFSV